MASQSTTLHSSRRGMLGCGRRGIGAAGYVEISAHCDDVWKMIINVDAKPTLHARVKSIERLDGSEVGTPLHLGSKFRERTSEYTVDLTVTSMSDDKEGVYPKVLTYWGIENDTAATTTVTVEAAGTERGKELEKSRVVLTFALVPRTFCGHIAMTLCFCYFDKGVGDDLQSDLDDIAAAFAERDGKEESNSCQDGA